MRKRLGIYKRSIFAFTLSRNLFRFRSQNLYGFAKNTPSGIVDVLGLQGQEEMTIEDFGSHSGGSGGDQITLFEYLQQVSTVDDPLALMIAHGTLENFPQDDFSLGVSLIENYYGNTNSPGGFSSIGAVAALALPWKYLLRFIGIGIVEGVEGLVATGAFFGGYLPYSFVNAVTMRVLPPPASKFYERAISGGGNLTIDRTSQKEWNNIITLISSDPNWKKAVQGVKKRVCQDIIAKGINKPGEITWQEIYGQKIREPNAHLLSHSGLKYGLGNVYTPYKWKPIAGKENLYKVTVYVFDQYDFHIGHVYQTMQNEGALKVYDITIEMEETFEICCPHD